MLTKWPRIHLDNTCRPNFLSCVLSAGREKCLQRRLRKLAQHLIGSFAPMALASSEHVKFTDGPLGLLVMVGAPP